jgi:ArsR family transcriptional regulator
MGRDRTGSVMARATSYTRCVCGGENAFTIRRFITEYISSKTIRVDRVSVSRLLEGILVITSRWWCVQTPALEGMYELNHPVTTPDPQIEDPATSSNTSALVSAEVPDNDVVFQEAIGGSQVERSEEAMISNVVEPMDAKSRCQIPELSTQLEKDLVQVFKLLADETRLRVLMYLVREGELHVTALCDKLNQSQPAVSHHLALLRVAGLIEARRDGKHNFYSIKASHFQRLMLELFSNLVTGDVEEVRFDDFALNYSPDYTR